MRRLKTVRRPPIYPKSPGHLPCSSLTHPLPLPSRRPSVSFGGFGLRLSLGFTSDEIRSTSNNGYQLESGKDPDEALLREAAESELMIALLTPDSMRSPDVANELATRRETGRWLIYLCARGVGPEEVGKRGWRSFALDASDSGQLYKFLEDVADGFGSALEKASSNMNLVNDLASAATRSTEHVDERGNDTVIDRLSEEAVILLTDAFNPRRVGSSFLLSCGVSCGT